MLLALLVPAAQGAAPSPAKVVSFEGPRPQVQLFLKTGNGYDFFVDGNRGRLTLAVANEDGEALYTVDAWVSTQRIKARLGSLGRIDLEFRPSGRAETLVPPGRCKGKEQLVREGVFVGTIEFSGERGYTGVDAQRARGSTAAPRSWRCRGERGESDGTLESPPRGVPVLGAQTPRSRAVFAAIGESEGFKSLRFFVAGRRECRGSMRVERAASAEGEPSTFSVQDDLGAATVRPPSPFSGTATLVRNPDGSTSWSGALSVALPGAGVVPLTGPGFKAELARPKTPAQFVDLIGLAPYESRRRC